MKTPLRLQRKRRLPALIPPGSLLAGPRKVTSPMVFLHSYFFDFPLFVKDESAVVDDSTSKVVAPPPVTWQKAAKAAALPPPPPS